MLARTNAPAMVRAAAWIEIAGPVACGATARTARAKRCSVALSLASPAGNASTRSRRLPSAAIQSARRSAGSVARVTGPASSSDRVWSSRTFSGAVTTASARARIASGPAASRSSAAASRAAAGSLAATSRSCPPTLRSAATVAASSARRRGVERVERQVEQVARVGDQRELGVLVVGDEAVERHHLPHLGQRRQARGDGGGGPGQHLDGVRRPVGVARQVGQRRHRRAVRDCAGDTG